MNLLKGKTALITGATRGIGSAIAKKFAENGANIAFTYLRSAENAKDLEQSLSKHGTKVISYQSDAGSYEAAEKLVKAVQQEFGQIDVLVNNAGITKDNLLLRMTEEQWDEVISTNLKSMFNLTKNTGWIMLKQKSGSIINISSVVGLSGNAGQSNYAASKAGVIGFTKSVAKELGTRNIRCNAIAPGFISTDMTKALEPAATKDFLQNISLHRLGEAEEIADVALFLASDMSSYVTSQVISVCGGMS